MQYQDLVGTRQFVRQFMHWTSLQACQTQIFVNNSVDRWQWNTCLTSNLPLIAVHLWFVFLAEDHFLHIVDDIRNASCARPAATRMTATLPVASIFLSTVLFKVHSLLGNILTVLCALLFLLSYNFYCMLRCFSSRENAILHNSVELSGKRLHKQWRHGLQRIYKSCNGN